MIVIICDSLEGPQTFFRLNQSLMTTLFAEAKKYDPEHIKTELDEGSFEFLTQQETLDNESTSVTSGVWADFRRLFDREANTLVENFAYCSHCKKVVAYFGTTTSQLLKHQRKCPKRPFVEGAADDPATINFKMDELKEIREAAAMFVVKDCQPFHAIKGKDLLDLCYASFKLGRKYPKMTQADLACALPVPNTIKPRVHQMAVEGKSFLTKKIRNSIVNTKRIAATADLWTDPQNSNSILALTLHFFTIEDATIKLENHTADLRLVNAPSTTGSVIKKTIVDIFIEYGLTEPEVDEFLCIVTDRGSNMLSAVSLWESEACQAHLINNVVKQMTSLPEVKTILSNASVLVRYMKTSHAGCQLTFRLKSYPDTRFNYVNDSLRSILDNYTEVYAALEAREDSSRNKSLTDKLTCLNIDTLKELCDFLGFFKEITTAIEGDRAVTLHRVWPVLRELRARLLPCQTDSDLIAAMRHAGLTYIDKQENVKYFTPSFRHRLALFLHPRMNQLPFMHYRGKRLFIH